MRIDTITESVTSDIVGYDESDHAYYALTNASQGYDGSDSTNYASVNLTRNSQAETHVYWEFGSLNIPSGATIDSVSCAYKARTSSSNTSYISSATIQLYSGTTAKGSSKSILSTSTSASTITTPGTWTAAEINAGVRLYTYAQRGTSRTTSNYYIYFYGATITVGYTITGTYYEITSTSNVTGVTTSPLSQEIFQDREGEVTISTTLTAGTDFKVTDNGTDVTSSLTSASGSIERYPASYSTSGSINGSNYTDCIGKSAEDPDTTSGNDYSNSSGTEAYIEYSFDFSDIPSAAAIQSVSVKVTGHCESTSSSSEVAELQLYSDSTAKGSMSEFTSTSDTTITMTPGTWTVSELQNAKLRFTIGYYGGKVQGVTWTVVYAVDGYLYTISNIAADHVVTVVAIGNDVYIKKNGSWVKANGIKVKVNGSWVDVSSVKKKISGSWVEQDKSAMFDSNGLYLNGN